MLAMPGPLSERCVAVLSAARTVRDDTFALAVVALLMYVYSQAN